MRIFMAGAAHSHALSDAANLAGLGGQICGAWNPEDSPLLHRLGAEHIAVGSESLAAALDRARPDLIVATVRPEWGVVLSRAAGSVPVFYNKTVASTAAGLGALSAEFGRAPGPRWSSSVLRFAPGLSEFAATIARAGVLGLRVHAQHDLAGFLRPEQRWQDEPDGAGGTAINVGIHAWELLDVVLPGAVILDGAHALHAEGSESASEEALVATLRVTTADGGQEIPVQLWVSAVSGDDRYLVEAITTNGIHRWEPAAGDPAEALGFHGLARTLYAGETGVSWSRTRVLYERAIAAARLARGEHA